MKYEKDCHKCGNELSSFDHCGMCGETRKILKVKKRRSRGKYELFLDEFECSKVKWLDRNLFILLLTCVVIGCIAAFLKIMEVELL